jgi:nucleotide-binding universal stress UspA family protein
MWLPDFCGQSAIRVYHFAGGEHMFPSKRILCPTDFSEAAVQAFSNAVEIAIHNEAEIYLVHVLPALLTDGGASTVMVSLPEYERLLQPKQRMEEMARPLLAKGLKVETLITRGDPASEIVKIAKQKAVDLIVIATHGKTGWRHLAFGSVAEKIVRTASCPVLSIRCVVRGAAASDGAR